MSDILYSEYVLCLYLDYLRNKYSASTVQTKEVYLKLFFNYIEQQYGDDEIIKKLNWESIPLDFIQYLCNMSEHRRKLAIGVIRELYSYLNDRRLIDRSQLSLLNKLYKESENKRKDPKERFKEYMAWKDVLTLLRLTISGYPFYNPYKLKSLVALIYFSGIRVQELKQIKRKDINLYKGTINAKKRQIFFPISIANLLLRYFNSEKEVDSAFNLNTSELQKINRILGHYRVKKIKVNLHKLRDFYIYRVLRTITNLEAIRRLTDLKDVTSLRNYRNALTSIKDIYDNQLTKGRKNVKS